MVIASIITIPAHVARAQSEISPWVQGIETAFESRMNEQRLTLLLSLCSPTEDQVKSLRDALARHQVAFADFVDSNRPVKEDWDAKMRATSLSAWQRWRVAVERDAKLRQIADEQARIDDALKNEWAAIVKPQFGPQWTRFIYECGKLRDRQSSSILAEPNIDVIAVIEEAKCAPEPASSESWKGVLSQCLESYVPVQEDRVARYVAQCRRRVAEQDLHASDGTTAVQFSPPAAKDSPALQRRHRDQVALEKRARDANRQVLVILEVNLPKPCFLEVCTAYWDQAVRITGAHWPRESREDLVDQIRRLDDLTLLQQSAIDETLKQGSQRLFGRAQRLVDTWDEWQVAVESGGVVSDDKVEAEKSRSNEARMDLVKEEDAVMGELWSHLTSSQQERLPLAPFLNRGKQQWSSP